MATKEMRVCDVYGTVKGVERVLVRIEYPEKNPGTKELIDYAVDLSPRAQDRLIRFIRRAIAPPKGTKTE